MSHKAGFVNIIGNPNVGKSTLMNALVGEKLSIITSKAQTTRHRIMGIVNGDDFQIVYSDTPGIIKPGYLLQESMMKYVSSAFLDADIILYVTDMTGKSGKSSGYLERLKTTQAPVIVALNKIDKSDQASVELSFDLWKSALPDAEIIPVSALHKGNLTYLFDRIIALLPENPPFYPKDTMTDKPVKFFVSEIIREKILVNYRKEIPYSVQVEIELFKETDRLVHVEGIIYVVRESQKGIIIGHQGKALKKAATQARIDIEKFLGKKVYLELFVKVKKDWRDKATFLRGFGYQ